MHSLVACTGGGMAVPPEQRRMADKIKVAIAVLLLIAGIAGFYFLSESPMVLRVASVLAGIAAGSVVGWTTEPGKRFFVFAQEAVVETKKVVWPTRKESLQTTGAVFAFVVAMAVFLWLTDKSLEYVMYDVLLGWKK
jgi:preprotein translocase subunit SecE